MVFGRIRCNRYSLLIFSGSIFLHVRVTTTMQQACSIKCKCKHCSNPFGRKPTCDSHGTKTSCWPEVKERYTSTTVCFAVREANSYIYEVGEQTTVRGFSKMEFLIICSIVDSVLRDESGHCNWGNAKGVYIIHT